MPIKVMGNKAQRRAVEKLLLELCTTAMVDPKTGIVTVGPGPHRPQHKLGCCCLSNLAAPKSRTVAIVPGTAKTPLPGAPGLTLGATGGGATATGPGATRRAGPGGGQLRGPGSNSIIWIDTTDNGGDGYFVFNAKGKKIDDPAFIILYHELCGGHATINANGLRDPKNPERDAIASENGLRRSQVPPYSLRSGARGGANAPGAGRAPR